jgi:hypothetical protein
LKEFRADLERLGARVDELEARVKELEEKEKLAEGLPVSIDLKHVQDIDSTRSRDADELNWSDRAAYLRADIATERQIDENWKASLKLIWVSGAAAAAESKTDTLTIPGRETDTLAIRELNLQGKVDLPILGESAVTLGRQFVKFGYGFLLDTNFAAVDGVRVDAKRLGLDWTFVGADIPTGKAFTDYYSGVTGADGMFGLRISRGFLGEDRLKIGLNGLFTGERNYRAYGADLTFRLLAGRILPEIRAEWVRNYRDLDGKKKKDTSKTTGNLFHVEADILKTDRINLTLSYTDASKGFSLQKEGPAIYNPFFITTTEQLFLRPVAFGANVTLDKTPYLLRDNVIDIRADLKIFGKNPISLRWFTGDASGDARRPDFGDVFTVAYRGWKIGRFALDVVYANKTAGDLSSNTDTTKRQYIGVAASASF